MTSHIHNDYYPTMHPNKPTQSQTNPLQQGMFWGCTAPLIYNKIGKTQNYYFLGRKKTKRKDYFIHGVGQTQETDRLIVRFRNIKSPTGEAKLHYFSLIFN